MNVFDFVQSINHGKTNLLAEDPANEKQYVPFIVNRSLSFSADTVLYANEINLHAGAPKKWQYDFLRLAIPKKKRYNKWIKNDTVTQDVELVQAVYQCSTKRALEYLTILTPQQLSQLKSSMSKGGQST